MLLATCTQVYSMSMAPDDASFGTMNLLQTTVLHRAAQTFAGRHSIGSTAEQTKQLIHLLDMDNDGAVSREEVNTFAFANGLDPSSVAGEFASIDTNGNGILEQEEVASLLDSGNESDSNAGSSITKSMENVPAGKHEKPDEELSGKVPLLKMHSVAASEVKPKLMEQPPEGDIEEYFAQVPVSTVQASKMASRSGYSGNSLASNTAQAVEFSEVKKGQVASGSSSGSLSGSMQYANAAANSAEISDSTIEMLLHEGTHKQQKSVGPAISATQKMAEQINSEVAAGAQSMTFQAAASTLRANASAILLHAQLEARAAAQKEANKVTMKNLKEINQLQARASKAEMRAAALRARAGLEMKEAYAAVAVASSSMAKIGSKNRKALTQAPVPAEPAAK